MFDRRAGRNAEEAARFDERLEELRSTLEARRVETELVAEILAARNAQLQIDRDLTLSVENEAPN